MQSDEVKGIFSTLRTWRSGGIRAPHKPLLLLYALVGVMRDEPRLFNYGNIKDEVRKLLMEFGPLRRSYRPSYPFLRLHNDGIWKSKEKKYLTQNKTGVTENLLRIIPLEIYQGVIFTTR